MSPSGFRTLLAIALGCLACVMAHAQGADRSAWKITPGPEGGWVEHLLPDGEDLLAGMGESGVFRLPKGETRWVPLHAGLTSRSIVGLGRSREGVLAAAGYAVHKLSADGKSWSVLAGYPGLLSYSLYADDSLVLVGADTGLVRSADGGKTWAFVRVGESPYLWCFGKLGRFLYAGSENDAGVYRSPDAGRTWTAVNEGLPLSQGISVYALQAHAGAVFAATTGGLFRSADSGAHWDKVEGGIPADAQFASLSSNGTELLAGSLNHGGFRTLDGGASWSALATPDSAGPIEAIRRIGDAIWMGTRMGGILAKRDMASGSEPANSGLQGVASDRLAVSDPLRAALWADRLYLSRDSGATWSVLSSSAKRDRGPKASLS